MTNTTNHAPAGIDLDKLQQYEPCWCTDGTAEMVEDADGGYVKLEDVRAALARRAAEDAPAAQRVWIINDDRGEHVMMCPTEPSDELMTATAKKIQRSITAEEFLLTPASIAHPIGQVSPAIDQAESAKADDIVERLRRLATDDVFFPVKAVDASVLIEAANCIDSLRAMFWNYAVSPSDATGKADAASAGELEAENERLKKLIDAMSREAVAHQNAVLATSAADAMDAERLDFLIQHEAWVAFGKDGESCRVFIRNDAGDAMPILGWGARHWRHNPREAIDSAMAASRNGKAK
jgi:hypothetical protein